MKPLRDTQGVAAVEFAVVAPVMIALLLPMADIGIAALRYISLYQELRSAGQYALYNKPPDLMTTTSDVRVYLKSYFASELPPDNASETSTVDVCGDTVASCGATVPASPPRSLRFTTTFKLQPIIWDVGCTSGCTVTYFERFE